MPIIVLISLPIMIGLFALFSAFATGQIQIAFLSQLFSTLGWGLAAFVLIRIAWWFFSPFQHDFSNAQPIPKVELYQLKIWDARHKKAQFNRDGSVIAYRYFAREKNVLWSIGSGMIGENPITRRERGSYKGGWNISDRVPTLNNTHGIYAAKTSNSPILDPYKYNGTILAKVELSGRLIEAEYGYRAQYCRILETYEG